MPACENISLIRDVPVKRPGFWRNNVECSPPRSPVFSVVLSDSQRWVDLLLGRKKRLARLKLAY